MNLPPDLIETLLTRSSVLVLQSQDYSSGDRSALFAINRLTETYLKSLIYRTISFARTNKRAKVNYDDIELSFFMESISLGSLEDELLRLNCGPSNEIDLTTSTEKVARGFESVDRKTQNQLLGPELNGRAGGIPDYMERNMVALPALPPLYTHKRTPIYAERTTSGLETRKAHTKENILAEASLRKLIEIEESTAADLAKEKAIARDADMEDDEDDRVTNVMLSKISPAEKQRRARENLFKQVWQEMGYGQVVKGRAVNCEMTAEANERQLTQT